jgi:ADP-ribosylglycohydrolase
VTLAALVHGYSREGLLVPDGLAWRALAERYPLHSEVNEIIQGSFRRKAPPEIRGSGYVVKSLEAALWAFAGATSFRDALLRAVNLGDDADTTGAICGQLAGAFWGESGIPEELRSGLARRDLLERALQGLLG